MSICSRIVRHGCLCVYFIRARPAKKTRWMRQTGHTIQFFHFESMRIDLFVMSFSVSFLEITYFRLLIYPILFALRQLLTSSAMATRYARWTLIKSSMKYLQWYKMRTRLKRRRMNTMVFHNQVTKCMILPFVQMGQINYFSVFFRLSFVLFLSLHAFRIVRRHHWCLRLCTEAADVVSAVACTRFDSILRTRTGNVSRRSFYFIVCALYAAIRCSSTQSIYSIARVVFVCNHCVPRATVIAVVVVIIAADVIVVNERKDTILLPRFLVLLVLFCHFECVKKDWIIFFFSPFLLPLS